MSIESYILGLQKNPSPGKIGKIVLGGLELLAGIYEKGVVKFYPAVIKADWKKSEELYLTDDLCGFPRNWREMSLI